MAEKEPTYSTRVAATSEGGDWIAELCRGEEAMGYVLVPFFSGPLDCSRLAQK